MNKSKLITTFIWIVFIVLMLLIYLSIKEENKKNISVHDHTEKWLLPISFSEIGLIEIYYKNFINEFKVDEKGFWRFKKTKINFSKNFANEKKKSTEIKELSSKYIARTIAMFSRTREEQFIPLKNIDEFGLQNPVFVIKVYSKNEIPFVTEIKIGTTSPDGYSRYILKRNTNEIITIAEYQIKNLMNLIKNY